RGLRAACRLRLRTYPYPSGPRESRSVWDRETPSLALFFRHVWVKWLILNHILALFPLKIALFTPSLARGTDSGSSNRLAWAGEPISDSSFRTPNWPLGTPTPGRPPSSCPFAPLKGRLVIVHDFMPLSFFAPR